MNWASSSENRSTFGSASVAPIDPARVGLASLITSLCDTFAAVSIISKLIRIQMLTPCRPSVKVFLRWFSLLHSATTAYESNPIMQNGDGYEEASIAHRRNNLWDLFSAVKVSCSITQCPRVISPRTEGRALAMRITTSKQG